MDSKLLMYAALGIGGYLIFQKYVAKKAEALAAEKYAANDQGFSLDSELNRLGKKIFDKIDLDILDGHPSMTPGAYLNKFYSSNSQETQFAGHHCG